MRVARCIPAFVAVALATTLATPVVAVATTPPAAPTVRSAGHGSGGSGGSGGGTRLTNPARPYRSSGRLQVRFNDGVTARGQEQALARLAAKGHKATVGKRSAALNAALLTVSDAPAAQRLLREDPAVRYVEPESLYRPFADTQTRERTAASLPTAASRDAGTALTGAGKEIAIIDSMVDTANPDLVGKVLHSADLTSDDPSTTTDFPCSFERCPHGTGVAAVAAAADGNGGVVGAAPGAAISSFNVFRRYQWENSQGDLVEDLSASSLDIAEALVAVKNRAATTPGLVAVNMSLGGSFDNRLIRDAIAQLRAAAPQVVVVVAAGNDGGERANFPAGDPGVVSVGASGQVPDGQSCGSVASATPWSVASFSNNGDVDLVAPGVCILTWYRGYSPTVDGQHAGTRILDTVDGTSFAAPMVAGVVALLASANVTGDAARAAIVASATEPLNSDVNYGVGSLNAANAIALATGSTPYTAAFLERGGQVANVVGRRNVEVLQVQPGSTTAPDLAAPTVEHGTLSDEQSATNGGVRRTTYRYAPPATDQGSVSFTMSAGSLTVPMRLLPPTNSHEGVPIASNEATSESLVFGASSGYIRSAKVPAGSTFKWTYGYGEGVHDPSIPPSSDLFVWQPATAGGDADAAFEPVYEMLGSTMTGSASRTPTISGRHLIGWLLFSSEDDSDAFSRYAFRPTYGPTATLNAPAIASATSATGPFTVSWAGANASNGKYDVQYMVKVKSGTTWVAGPWKPWLTQTTAKSAVFGANKLPVPLAYGQTYHFRVGTYDVYGNTSVPVSKYTVVPLDNTYYGFGYAGTWAKGGATARWGGTVHYSGTKGASLTVRSETSQFTIVGDKCSACGQFQVYLDGVYKGIVDTRAGGTYARSILWTSPNLGAPKPHTVKLVVVGTAGRPRVVVDAVGSLR